MWEWLKRLFGFAEVVLSLDEKHSAATKAGEIALSAFTYAADKLQEAAEALDVIAGEAFELAEKYGQQANAAVAEAQKNVERATKIRDLLG